MRAPAAGVRTANLVAAVVGVLAWALLAAALRHLDAPTPADPDAPGPA